MKNKTAIVLLICLFLSMLPVKVTAESSEKEVHITSVEELEELSHQCYLDTFSENMNVYLEQDLDLTDSEFQPIPIFNGYFHGNGHTISGLELTAETSNTGFFRYIGKKGVVDDLHLQGSVQPAGTREKAGGIAGENNGQILHCSFEGEVSGSDYIGGIAGVNAVTGIIDSSTMTGQVHGIHFSGGISGLNNGTIRGCTNFSNVNNSVSDNEISLQDVKVTDVTNTESVNSVTDIGGIAGSNAGVIHHCVNEATIGYQHVGYNVGGIAGSQRGFITECTNNALVLGRKEVGGIAGQMEPVSNIEYKKDTLQILKGQIGSVNATVSRINQNAKNNSDSIQNQLSTLQNQGNDAMRVITELLPSQEDPHFPDKDTLIAAKNNLNSSISAMNDTMNGINETSKEATKHMADDIEIMVNQMNNIGTTIGHASDHVGISVKDISDQDTEEDTTGKISYSVNSGKIKGDINVGGIAGAMAFENDFDPEDDFQFTGNRSINVDSELRSVIVSSQNYGSVEVKKKNAGGIVGNMAMGMVKGCINTGEIFSKAADMLGGIAGTSAGTVRDNQVRAELTGHNNIAGIAGTAEILINNKAMISIHDGVEKTGGILGEKPTAEKEEQMKDNIYLKSERFQGAVDGIDYEGAAQGMEFDEFMAQEDLASQLKNVTIRFEADEKLLKQITVDTGTSIEEKDIPEIPERKGYTAGWDSFIEENHDLMFDKTYTAVYESHSKTLTSTLTENNKPVVLLTGEFMNRKEFELQEAETAEYVPENDDTLIKEYILKEVNKENINEVHLLIPDVPVKELRVYMEMEGHWKPVSYEKDGSYVVFKPDTVPDRLALVRRPSQQGKLICGGLAAAGIVLAIIFRRVVKNKSKKNK